MAPRNIQSLAYFPLKQIAQFAYFVNDATDMLHINWDKRDDGGEFPCILGPCSSEGAFKVGRSVIIGTKFGGGVMLVRVVDTQFASARNRFNLVLENALTPREWVQFKTALGKSNQVLYLRLVPQEQELGAKLFIELDQYQYERMLINEPTWYELTKMLPRELKVNALDYIPMKDRYIEAVFPSINRIKLVRKKTGGICLKIFDLKDNLSRRGLEYDAIKESPKTLFLKNALEAMQRPLDAQPVNQHTQRAYSLSMIDTIYGNLVINDWKIEETMRIKSGDIKGYKLVLNEPFGVSSMREGNYEKCSIWITSLQSSRTNE
jgi:hypothetical protein